MNPTPARQAIVDRFVYARACKFLPSRHIPGVNNLKQYGRWAFAEFTEVYQIEDDFKTKVESEFNNMIAKVTQP